MAIVFPAISDLLISSVMFDRQSLLQSRYTQSKMTTPIDNYEDKMQITVIELNDSLTNQRSKMMTE